MQKASVATVAVLLAAWVGIVDAGANQPPATEIKAVSLPTVAMTPGPDEPHVLTANLASGCSSSACGGSGIDKANELLSIALNGPRNPTAISVQEICSSSTWNHLYGWLVASGLQYRTAEWRNVASGPGPLGPKVCGGYNRWFGSAVYWLGLCYANDLSQCIARGGFSPQASGDTQYRGAVCGRGAWPDYWACSAHMTNSSPSAAYNQSSSHRSQVDFLRLLSPAAFASGDFNKTPPTAFDPGALPSPYVEAGCYFLFVRCTTFESSPPKIYDYAYSSVCRTRNGNVFDLIYSDHEMLQGFFSGC